MHHRMCCSWHGPPNSRASQTPRTLPYIDPFWGGLGPRAFDQSSRAPPHRTQNVRRRFQGTNLSPQNLWTSIRDLFPWKSKWWSFYIHVSLDSPQGTSVKDFNARTTWFHGMSYLLVERHLWGWVSFLLATFARWSLYFRLHLSTLRSSLLLITPCSPQSSSATPSFGHTSRIQ